LSVTPVLCSTFLAAAPHGTCGAQVTTASPALFRSAKDLMPLGLPGATAMASLFVANTVAWPSITPPWLALSIVAWSAEAKTSAFAPLVSCCTRVDEPAKLNFTVVPGCWASNSLPSAVNDSVSDAAANTVSVPPPAFPAPLGAGAVTDAPGCVLGSSELLHAPANRATAATARASCDNRGFAIRTPEKRFFIDFLPVFPPRHWSP
jgi:hypothetical protein